MQKEIGRIVTRYAVEKKASAPGCDKEPGHEKLAILRRTRNGCGMRILDARASLSVLGFWRRDVGAL